MSKRIRSSKLDNSQNLENSFLAAVNGSNSLLAAQNAINSTEDKSIRSVLLMAQRTSAENVKRGVDAIFTTLREAANNDLSIIFEMAKIIHPSITDNEKLAFLDEG